jgi:hypothetical protein
MNNRSCHIASILWKHADVITPSFHVRYRPVIPWFFIRIGLDLIMIMMRESSKLPFMSR